MALQGGCLCGAIRFEIERIFDAGFCHCSTCRRWTGSPVSAWANVLVADFRLVAGAPTQYRSSSYGVREHCAVCGTPLFFREDGSPCLAINTPALDEPEKAPPQSHIYYADKLSWLEMGDALPRYPAGELPAPGKR